MARVRSSEVQMVVSVCDSKKEAQGHCGEHALDVLACFAGFQPLSNSVRGTTSENTSLRVGGKDLTELATGEGVAVERP